VNSWSSPLRSVCLSLARGGRCLCSSSSLEHGVGWLRCMVARRHAASDRRTDSELILDASGACWLLDNHNQLSNRSTAVGWCRMVDGGVRGRATYETVGCASLRLSLSSRASRRPRPSTRLTMQSLPAALVAGTFLNNPLPSDLQTTALRSLKAVAHLQRNKLQQRCKDARRRSRLRAILFCCRTYNKTTMEQNKTIYTHYCTFIAVYANHCNKIRILSAVVLFGFIVVLLYVCSAQASCTFSAQICRRTPPILQYNKASRFTVVLRCFTLLCCTCASTLSKGAFT